MALIFCLRPARWAPYIAGTPSGNACLGSGLSAGNAESLTDSMGAHTGTHTHTQTCREWTTLHWRAKHIIERVKKGAPKGKKWQNSTEDGQTEFTTHFFREACGLPQRNTGRLFNESTGRGQQLVACV